MYPELEILDRDERWKPIMLNVQFEIQKAEKQIAKMQELMNLQKNIIKAVLYQKGECLISRFYGIYKHNELDTAPYGISTSDYICDEIQQTGYLRIQENQLESYMEKAEIEYLFSKYQGQGIVVNGKLLDDIIEECNINRYKPQKTLIFVD